MAWFWDHQNSFSDTFTRSGFRSIARSIYCSRFVSVVGSFFYSIFLSNINPILISWSWIMGCFWTRQNPLSESFIISLDLCIPIWSASLEYGPTGSTESWLLVCLLAFDFVCACPLCVRSLSIIGIRAFNFVCACCLRVCSLSVSSIRAFKLCVRFVQPPLIVNSLLPSINPPGTPSFCPL